MVLALPTALVVAVDFALRGGRMVAFPAKYVGSYAVAVLESLALWGLLLGCGSSRRGRWRSVAAALFVLLAMVAVGGQVYFYGQYSTYINLDATLFGTSVTESVFGQLETDRANFAACVLPALGAAAALVWLGRKLVRTRRRTARRAGLLVLPALVAVLLIPCSYRSVQGSTPDVLYFHAMGGILKSLTGVDPQPQLRPGRRSPPALPPLAARPAKPRNVLLILTESIRADCACPRPVARCPNMPFTNRAAPDRLPLAQMRANTTTTAIELAVLWTGLGPNAGREPLHRAPALFDFAHAAGWDTAYWSSHHPMFANTRLWLQDLPVSFHCSATQLDPEADIDLGADDRLLTARVESELPRLREPFFAMVQYGNTHAPYLADPAMAPYQPARMSRAERDLGEFHNHYRNAVYRQDQTVAALIDFVRRQPFGARTVVVYSSDHGEQFHEHGQLGHTGSLFEVELHAPSWIDAPAGTLVASEREAIGSYAEAPTFHSDLVPTVLDLMGLWDEPTLGTYRSQMIGASLLRAGKPETTMALTNCAGVWGCALPNWGVMRGWRKLHARAWDRDWLCYDVKSDPDERHPLPLASCADLRAEAERIFGGRPGG